MTTLEKLADSIHETACATKEDQMTWADTLDAYIKAQGSAEPVLWMVVGKDGARQAECTYEESADFVRCWDHNHPGNAPHRSAPLFIAPPPREPISQKALMAALWARSSELTRTEMCIEPEKVIEALRALCIEIAP